MLTYSESTFCSLRYCSRSSSSVARPRTASSSRAACTTLPSRCSKPLFELFHFLGQRNDHVRQRVLHIVRIGNQHALALAVDDVGRIADNGGIGWNIAQHYRTGADARVLANGDVSQNVGAIAHEDAVAQGRMTLAFLLAGASQGYVLVESDVVADNRSLADDHAHAMIDEQAPSDVRSGVYLNAGPEARHLRAKTRQKPAVVLP